MEAQHVQKGWLMVV